MMNNKKLVGKINKMAIMIFLIETEPFCRGSKKYLRQVTLISLDQWMYIVSNHIFLLITVCRRTDGGRKLLFKSIDLISDTFGYTE